MKRIIMAYIAALLLSIIYCEPKEGEIITALTNSVLNGALYIGIWYILTKWDSSKDDDSWRSKLAYYFLFPLWLITIINIIILILNRNFSNFMFFLPTTIFTYLTLSKNKRSI